MALPADQERRPRPEEIGLVPRNLFEVEDGEQDEEEIVPIPGKPVRIAKRLTRLFGYRLSLDKVVPFQRINSAYELFPDVDDSPITLHHPAFKKGGLNNQAMMFVCHLIASGQVQGIILEFGTHEGRTTLNMATNLRPENRVSGGPTIHTIDLGSSKNQRYTDERSKYRGYETARLFRDLPIRKDIHQLIGDSRFVDLQYLTGRVGLALIDGGHSEEVCWSDMMKALPLLMEGGIMLVDDYRAEFWPGVDKAVDRFAQEYKGKVEIKYAEKEKLVIVQASA